MTDSTTSMIVPTSTDVDVAATFAPLYTDIAGQLAPRSRLLYRSDMQTFATWLVAQGLTLESLSRSDMIAYRQFVADKYAKSTAARLLTVARRVLAEAVLHGQRLDNPAQQVRGFKGVSNVETTHTALTLDQASALLRVIDKRDLKGQRDYCMIAVMLRTGIRRSELATIQVGDMNHEQGHHVIVLRHAKGDKLHKVKLPVEVQREIAGYMSALNGALKRLDAPTDAPLFVRFYKGDTPSNKPMSGEGIEQIVTRWGKASGVAGLTPHDLRATFITGALEGGAKLQQVQYAAGHADPRTTERYQKRKLNLDDNAVDYFRPRP